MEANSSASNNKNRDGDRDRDLDKKFMELAKKNLWQRCPRCLIFVERSSGCEHITCRCGCNFCYMCGKNWEQGHLCNNPCHNTVPRPL